MDITKSTLQNLHIRICKKFRYVKLKLQSKVLPVVITGNYNPEDFSGLTYPALKIETAKQLNNLLSSINKQKIIKCLEQSEPNIVGKTVEKANAICSHTFKIFGENYNLGEIINWHKDIVSGFEWPLHFYSDIQIINLSDDSDVKFPWELNMFFHSVTLGKAYWFTEDEKYVEEFINQLHSWIENNPPDKGINWNCSMEVARRAINLIWAYCFFIESKRLSGEFHILFHKLIYAHGIHIYKNLENNSLVKGNHYITNLLGLLYIGTFFPIIKNSEQWKSFASSELVKSISEQVNADGSNFEGSIPYHRLVTEMFLHAAILTILKEKAGHVYSNINLKSLCGTVFGSQYIERLEKMCEFVLSYTKPDGLAPQIGDNDSGRLVKLEGGDGNDVNDHRHILAVAGEFFNRDDFRCSGQSHYGDAIWLFGGHIKQPGNGRVISTTSKGYADAGIYIMRNDEDFLIVRCGNLGTGGKGTHTHNDNLSFELCANGTTYIVDPGTYTYSRNIKMRNLFRSTEYHNTLVVDGEEQNFLSEKDIFLLHKKSNPKILTWQQEADSDFWVGEISFILSRGGEIAHRRAISFDKKSQYWELKDTVCGTGRHNLAWYFHAAQGISIDEKNNFFSFNSMQNKNLNMQLRNKNDYSANIVNGWYSPSYSQIKKSIILKLSIETELPYESNISFSIN